MDAHLWLVWQMGKIIYWGKNLRVGLVLLHHCSHKPLPLRGMKERHYVTIGGELRGRQLRIAIDGEGGRADIDG